MTFKEYKNKMLKLMDLEFECLLSPCDKNTVEKIREERKELEENYPELNSQFDEYIKKELEKSKETNIFEH
ncbi:MAG: hypothetical protein IKP65_06685 [Alphaproteobacteria bacterium]|nr:hypothetical protein [Alphaproteobacteria bacterium]